MKANDLAIGLIDNSNMSRRRVANAIGVSPQSFNTTLMKTGDMKAGMLHKVLDLLGYELIAVPKGSAIPRGSYKVDNDKSFDPFVKNYIPAEMKKLKCEGPVQDMPLTDLMHDTAILGDMEQKERDKNGGEVTSNIHELYEEFTAELARRMTS